MKILHLYWGRNTPLSHLRYMTAETFSIHNPEWKIRIHSPKTSCLDVSWETKEHKRRKVSEDCFERLYDLQKVTFHLHDLPEMAEVHRSDLLRWKLLGEHGGVWSDFDIYYLKPVPEQIERMETGLCRIELKQPVYPIGFLVSKPNNAFFTGLYEKALSIIPKGYQDLGRTLLEANLGEHELFDADCVYPVKPNRIKDLQQKMIFPDKTFGVHWYAGHESAITEWK